jgi:hypothetical protein
MQLASMTNLTSSTRSARMWEAIDREITDDAYWVPTENLREVDLVSARLHNYECNPVWGFLADRAWVSKGA